jgi:hypothetical protein
MGILLGQVAVIGSSVCRPKLNDKTLSLSLEGQRLSLVGDARLVDNFLLFMYNMIGRYPSRSLAPA